MTFSARVPVIYGGSGIGAPTSFCKLNSIEKAQPVIDAWCRIVGPSAIDTSNVYGGRTSESLIAQLDLQHFVIDTKNFPSAPGDHSFKSLKAAANQSFEILKGHKIRTFYLHAPDRSVNFKETLQAIDELHKEGKFEQFGLSNFRTYEVAEFATLARENGWVRPTVYEGLYNPIDRLVEADPLAGGLLVGHLLQPENSTGDSIAEAQRGTGSHYDPKKPFSSWFLGRYGGNIPAVRVLKEAVEANVLSLNQASVRWLQHHGKLLPSDFIIFGGSDVGHVEKTLEYCTEGPLPDKLVEAFETCYKAFKGDLPDFAHSPPWYDPKVHGD